MPKSVIFYTLPAGTGYIWVDYKGVCHLRSSAEIEAPGLSSPMWITDNILTLSEGQSIKDMEIGWEVVMMYDRVEFHAMDVKYMHSQLPSMTMQVLTLALERAAHIAKQRGPL